MPWPKPQADETEEEFIQRCVTNEYIQQDIPTQSQRLAVCYQQWENRGKTEANMEMYHKSFIGVELKADKPGAFTARIATLNVIDKDGDVTLPGAFPQGKEILISSYMHGSWMGGLPVGKGVIREEGDEVFVDGQFNLNTQTGKEHYETIKFAPELQEWSYGFIVKALDEESEWAKNPNVWRVLKELDVFEASPVLRGAGVDTATLAIKNNTNDPLDQSNEKQGMTFVNQAETALAAVNDLAARAKSLADLRRKEGRTLSVANRELVSGLHDALKAVAVELQQLLEAAEPDSEKVRRLYGQFLKIQNELRGAIK